MKSYYVHYDCPYCKGRSPYKRDCTCGDRRESCQPPVEFYMANLKEVTLHNQQFRKELWTGEHLQLTVMCIPPGCDIGLERHELVDQFIYVESGSGCVCLGNHKHELEVREAICPNCSIIIPAGTWHNIINTGNGPLKLFSIYAPPEHQICD